MPVSVQMTTPGLAQELISAQGIIRLFQMTDDRERLPMLLSEQFFFLEVEFCICVCFQRYGVPVLLVLSGFQNYKGCYLVDDLLKHCDRFFVSCFPSVLSWSLGCFLPGAIEGVQGEYWYPRGEVRFVPGRGCRVPGKGLSNSCKVNHAGNQMSLSLPG